jgi:hypothetical protein
MKRKQQEQLHIEPVLDHFEEVEIARSKMAGTSIELLVRIQTVSHEELPVIAYGWSRVGGG